MNFCDERIKSAEKVIKIAAVLRLFMIAAMAISLARVYADNRENLVRLYNETYREDKSFFGIIIFGIVLDMVLTVL